MTPSKSPLAWERSRRCDSSACVEAAALNGEVLVRASKSPDGPVLRFTQHEWEAFVGGVQDGDFSFFN